jgi:hypothetical protein
MRKTLIVAGLVLALAACSKGNTKVTDQGHTLAPRSGVFFSGTVLFFNIGGVLITDAAGACDAITRASPPASPCNASRSPLDTSALNTSTALSIVALPAGQGTFNVIDPNAPADGGSQGLHSGAGVSFSTLENGRTTFTDAAVSGTVKFDHFESGKSAQGSYDVVMQSGAHLSGNFDATDCPVLDQAISASFNSDRSCSASSGTNSCTGSCSCKGQTVQASCAGPADGGSGDWSCTCTGASGATTTCTEPAPSSASLGCRDRSSCCPLTF